MSFTKELGENIRDARLREGMTLRQLGQQIGTSASAVCMYENGKRLPSVMTVSLIADVLSVSLDDLVPQVSPVYDDDVDQTTIYDYLED